MSNFEAMKLALEAQERAWLWMENQADGQSKGGHATFDLMMLREERDALQKSITALRQAIEQAEQVQHLSQPCQCGKQTNAWCLANTCSKAEQAQPVAWVSQANLNSAAITRNRGGQGDTHTWSETPTWDHSVPLYTAPAPRQPVDTEALAAELKNALAWGMAFGPVIPASQWHEMRDAQVSAALERLAAPPPRQPWVGLTTEEVYACDEQSGLPQREITTGDLQAFAQAIEAKLKEKNT